MSFWKRLFGDPAKPPVAELVYVRLPGRIEPLDRGDRFEDPLIERLEASGLGFVSGGGSSLGPPREDGSRVVVFAGIDIEAYDVAGVRALLREHLSLLDAPLGTQIEFTRDGARLQDVLGPNGWSLDADRTDVHPGFGL
jgi:hypothetical protein